MRSLTARAAFAALALLITLAGCDASGEDRAGDTTSAPPSGGQSVGESPPVPTPPSAPAAELDDGVHPGYITAVDSAGGRLTFDLVVFLTGAAAREEYLKRNPSETDGPPNDYLIVNDNSRLRTLAVTSDAVITIKPTGDPTVTQTVALADLPGAVPLEFVMFWLTVSGGEVTEIEQQWVP